eukprot:2174735-Rhodomonas_salina.2
MQRFLASSSLSGLFRLPSVLNPVSGNVGKTAAQSGRNMSTAAAEGGATFEEKYAMSMRWLHWAMAAGTLG